MTDGSHGFDPITVEVLRNKLEGAAEEMEATLLRSSFSPIVKEGLDASASLFTAEGETLAQAVAIPIHLATLIPVVQKIVRECDPATMREGDIFAMNDPYLGGTHLPDIALVMPIFADGRVIAFSATMTHHQDMGGLAPGSVPTNATEIYQEGLRIPLVKLRDAGEINRTLIAMIRQNVRIPDVVEGDLNAQIAACSVGARRVVELAGRYGAEDTLGMFQALLDRSETMTRQAIREIPDGSYSYTDYLDNDGIDLDRRIRIQVTVRIDGDRMICDFEGTSAQVRGPFNCVPSGSQAAAYFAVRAATDPTIPTNGGCFRPVELVLPEGSLVNPREPAPVNSRTATIKRVTGSILAALKEVLPERIPADNAGEMLALMFGGERPDGSRYVVGELLAGGSGASRERDGVDSTETDATNCMNLPVEALEMDAPVRVLRYELRTDSGGAGESRGGLGPVREYEILHGDVRFTHRGERHYASARGAAGGHAGANARSVILRRGGEEEEIPSKLVTTLHAGDRVRLELAGGAGYGDPRRRDPGRVRADVADGKVSARAARELYGRNEDPN
jgi:N-methylhydantoinase B/oxoprolinase/acetone carboxylase alpha subunit